MYDLYPWDTESKNDPRIGQNSWTWSIDVLYSQQICGAFIVHDLISITAIIISV